MRYSEKTMRIKTIICLFVALTMFNCKEKIVENWDQENTRDVTVNDVTYLKAIEKAKENLPQFIDLLKSEEKNRYDFYIKAKFSESINTEHLWFVVDTLKGKRFSATLDNVPLNLKNIKLNDKVEIQISDIEDWIIYRGDSIISGNYIAKTIK